jgi:hypothetical protein
MFHVGGGHIFGHPLRFDHSPDGPIVILTLARAAVTSVEAVMAAWGDGLVFATDFYVSGAETWSEVPGGLAHLEHPVVNVDHHSPIPAMEMQISSTNLALQRLAADLAPSPHSDAVVINHMDCDSVLASGVLDGRLEPNPVYGDSAIAADHTGQEDAIADLLQGLDAHWSRTRQPMPDPEGLEYFFESLNRSEQGLSLDAFAKEALGQRQRSRDRAERAVLEGRIEYDQGVAFGVLDEPIEGELLLTCLPEASLVCTMNPHPVAPERWQVKIRLGLAAQGGRSLHQLRIVGFDPAYGGRWNAGSNNRGGGTDLSPDAYIQRLLTELSQQWG